MQNSFSNSIQYKSQFGQINCSKAIGDYYYKGSTTGIALKYVVKGEEGYYIDDQLITVPEGHFILVQPEICFEAKPNTQNVETKGLCIDLSTRLSPLKNKRVLANELLFNKSFGFSSSTTIGQRLCQAGTLINHNDHVGLTHDFLLELTHQLNVFSEDVIQYQKEIYNVAKKESTRDAIILKLLSAKEYVVNHYHDQILLSHLAQHVGMSKFQLLKLFKICFHCSPQKMQMALRMKSAKKLIEIKEQSLSQMAIDLGYCDLAAFSKAFKSYYGVSPSYFKN